MRSWSLISPEEVRQIIRTWIPPRRDIHLPLEQLCGKTLAEPLKVTYAHPPFRQSSVDGYALGNLQETSYRVIGESKAGTPFAGQIGPSEAIRIFTGAAVPNSAVAIVMQEKTQVKDQHLHLLQNPVQGAFIREKGEQFLPGATLFPAGHILTPAHIGLLHGLGISSAQVYEPPKMQVVVTGHEIVPFPRRLKEGQIWDENGPALQAYCAQHHLRCQLDYTEDELEAVIHQIKKGFEADLLILTGGVSVGDYDMVPEALMQAGVEKWFHGVRQKPGKPLWMGKKDHTLVLALPGNPAAVMCIWHLYLYPLIQYFMGKPLVFPEEMAKPYLLGGTCSGEMERTTYLRARLQNDEVIPLSRQASYMLGGFIEADGLAVLPAGKTGWTQGDQVHFIPF